MILSGGLFRTCSDLQNRKDREKLASRFTVVNVLHNWMEERRVVSELFRDQKSTLRQTGASPSIHMPLRPGSVPENFHASGMIICLLGCGMTSERKVKLHPSEWNRTLFCLQSVCGFSFSFFFFHTFSWRLGGLHWEVQI